MKPDRVYFAFGWVVKKIETALLRSEELEYRPFRIEVEDGQVTMSGYIGSETEKQAALRVAATIDGVGAVIDNLHVQTMKHHD